VEKEQLRTKIMLVSEPAQMILLLRSQQEQDLETERIFSSEQPNLDSLPGRIKLVSSAEWH